MDKTINYLVIGVFAVIVFYYMVSVAYTIASPNSIQAIAFTVNNTYNATTNRPIVTVNSVSNATYTFLPSHYVYNTTHIKLVTNGTEGVGTYNVNYDYEAASTVFGMNLAFVAVLVLLGAGIMIASKLTKA